MGIWAQKPTPIAVVAILHSRGNTSQKNVRFTLSKPQGSPHPIICRNVFESLFQLVRLSVGQADGILSQMHAFRRVHARVISDQIDVNYNRICINAVESVTKFQIFWHASSGGEDKTISKWRPMSSPRVRSKRSSVMVRREMMLA